MAVIGQDGSVLTLTTWRGAPRPPVCCAGPRDAEGDVEVGVDGHPGGADLALVARSSRRRWPPGWPRPSRRGRRPPRPRRSKTSVRPAVVHAGHQAGTAGHHPGGVGQVHGVEVGLEQRRPARGRRGAPSIGAEVQLLDAGLRASRRRRRHGGARRPPTARVTTAGPSHLDRDQHPVVEPGHQGPHARCPVVPVVGGPTARASRGRPVAAASRGARSRPSGEAAGRPAASAATTGARAAARAAGPEPGPGVGPPAVGRRRATRAAPPRPPSPTTSTRPPASATASCGPDGQPAVPGHDHGHGAGPGRPPVERRSQRHRHPVALDDRGVGPAGGQAVADPVDARTGRRRSGPPQVVLGLLVDGAHHPVAARGPGRSRSGGAGGSGRPRRRRPGSATRPWAPGRRSGRSPGRGPSRSRSPGRG